MAKAWDDMTADEQDEILAQEAQAQAQSAQDTPMYGSKEWAKNILATEQEYAQSGAVQMEYNQYNEWQREVGHARRILDK